MKQRGSEPAGLFHFWKHRHDISQRGKAVSFLAGERFCRNRYQLTFTMKEINYGYYFKRLARSGNVNNTTVSLTVTYTLTPNAVEAIAGTVFSEDIRLIGNDAGIANDIVITTFPGQVFVAAAATVRVRTRNVLKSAMNEDPGCRLSVNSPHCPVQTICVG